MKKLLIMLLTITLLLAQVSTIKAGETKDEPSSWAEVDINELANLNEFDEAIFNNYKGNITRSEFIYLSVKVFEMLLGEEVTLNPDIKFSDTTDIWALKGATVGITSGIGQGKFGPDESLSREQFATMIIRTLQIGQLTLADGSEVSFVDEETFSSWAKESIMFAKANNIINGVGESRFAPKDLATKQQSLAIINRIIKRFNGEEFKYDSTDSIVALSVNDSKVMLDTVNIFVYQIKMFYEQNYGADVWDRDYTKGVTMEEQLKEDIKNILISREVLYDYAMNNNLELEADVVITNRTRANSIFEEFSTEAVAKYGLTLEELVDILNKDSYGTLAYKDLIKDVVISDEALASSLVDNEDYQYKIENKETINDEVRARHILIKTVDDLNQPLSAVEYTKAREEIEALLIRAKAGEDFATLAREHTQDPGSVSTGGEYTFGRGVMVKEFEDAAFALEVGGISEIVETQYGFHILKLEEKIPSSESGIALVEEEIKELEEEARKGLISAEWIDIYETLKEQYTIEIEEEVWNKITFK